MAKAAVESTTEVPVLETERIVVPSGMFAPVTSIPARKAPVSVESRPVTVVEPATVLPLSSMAEKVRVCVRWAVEGAESVTDVGVLLTIVALSGMPGPVTGIPISRAVVDEIPEMSGVPALAVPVRFFIPAPNVSAAVPAAVAFAESVSDVVSMIEAIVALAGIPGPVTGIPTSRVAVEETAVISGLPMIVVPLEARAAVPNANDEVITESTSADSVTPVGPFIDRIVVPKGMPSPLTPIPSRRPEVVERLVTVGVPPTTVPVSGAVSRPAVTSRSVPLAT